MRFIKILSIVFLITILTSSFTMSAFASESIKVQFSGEERTFVAESITKVKSNGDIKTKPSWIASYLTTDIDHASNNDPFILAEEMRILADSGKVDLEVYKDEPVDIYLRAMMNLTQFKLKLSEEMINSSNSTHNTGTTGNVEDLSVLMDNLHIISDHASAETLMGGFIPILNVALGVITTLITIGMTFFTAFDVAYIAFPVVRTAFDDAVTTNNPKMTKTNSKTGETELRFVSDDAQYAVKTCSIESGKSPWGLYFKRRLVSYIMLAIILFILLTGNIDLITNIVLNMIGGIMEVLQNLAA